MMKGKIPRKRRRLLRARAEVLEERKLLSNLTIAQENALPGTPPSVWDIHGEGDESIQGYATDISVNRGSTINFKIDDWYAEAYHIDVYRMGYYQGNGARLVATISPSQTQDLVVAQPDPITDPSTGLVDCGNWSVTASWQVPNDATSGIYFARVTIDSTGGASHIVFVVRNDASHSDLLYQTSDSTWEAYNTYGGNSLYVGSPVGRAYKVSYNRPFDTRENTPEDWVFATEYPMVRFLEANGYDVSYSTGVDAARNGGLIKNHKVYLSVGHDEYWSGDQRASVEAAVKAGVNLTFFSGNEVYWKTRWENSVDGSNTPYRTMVCYKESTDDQTPGAPIPSGVIAGYNLTGIADPSPIWTGIWRDTRFGGDAEVEQTLTGQLWSVNRGTGDLMGTAIKVPAEFASMRVWRNTSIAQLQPGQTATLANGTLGYEWDEDVDSGFRPVGTIDLSRTTESVPQKLIDPLSWPGCAGTPGSLCARCRGCLVAAGTATHSITEHRDPTSSALIFDVGTIQWSWGLDSHHDEFATTPDVRMQQATVNMLADQGAMPATLIAGLVPATQSTDTVGPSSAFGVPQDSTIVTNNGFATITGTATDSGGGVVAGVEISIDAGVTWHPVTSAQSSWSYTWSPATYGVTNIRVRSTDDSANVGATISANFSVQQVAAAPVTIWSDATTPGTLNDDDDNAVEVGLKFRTDAAGVITGLRYYKGDQNTGTHVGHLWTSAGTLLASATFTNESSTGWQTVMLSSPVAVQANITYVVSYHTDVGHYSSDSGYFIAGGFDHQMLHALAEGVDGHNSVYSYGGGAFPTTSFSSANYWVDVVFSDTIAPSVVRTTPTNAAAQNAAITATFSEPVQSSTIVVSMRDDRDIVIPATVTYDANLHAVTLHPSVPLSRGKKYVVNVSGARDLVGNAMSSAMSWTFSLTPAGAAGNGGATGPRSSLPPIAGGTVAAALFDGPQDDSSTLSLIRGS